MKRLFTVLLFLGISLSGWTKIYQPSDDLRIAYYAEKQSLDINAIVEKSVNEYQSFLKLDTNSQKLNEHYFNDLEKPLYLPSYAGSRSIQAAAKNPVVSLYQYDKYDPDQQGIGFCFGRAMFIDLYLAINGLNRGSIKKAFVMGAMTSGDGASWGWHVTTIVQSLDARGQKTWLALDPIMGQVMSVMQWYQETLNMSVDGKLRLYITDAGKFSPRPSQYNYRSMNDDFYNNYFTDMMKWFATNDISDELGL